MGSTNFFVAPVTFQCNGNASQVHPDPRVSIKLEKKSMEIDTILIDNASLHLKPNFNEKNKKIAVNSYNWTVQLPAHRRPALAELQLVADRGSATYSSTAWPHTLPEYMHRLYRLGTLRNWSSIGRICLDRSSGVVSLVCSPIDWFPSSSGHVDDACSACMHLRFRTRGLLSTT